MGEILVKISEKMWMKSTEFTLFSRKFKPRYLPVKNENQKIFLIPYSTLDKLSNGTSLNSLRWIYRSAKIDWTKKTQLSIYFPPPSRGVGTIKINSLQNLLTKIYLAEAWIFNIQIKYQLEKFEESFCYKADKISDVKILKFQLFLHLNVFRCDPHTLCRQWVRASCSTSMHTTASTTFHTENAIRRLNKFSHWMIKKWATRLTWQIRREMIDMAILVLEMVTEYLPMTEQEN